MRNSPGVRIFRSSWQILSAFVVLVAILETVPVQSNLHEYYGAQECPRAIFNFGDSLTDTGAALNTFPFFNDPENPPYGEMFFQRPAKRFTNGRNVNDFFSLAFEKPLLQPYLQAGAFDYRFGVNFAFGGATASNDTSRYGPIFLPFQIGQFIRFKKSAESQKQQLACAQTNSLLPSNSAYGNALYTIEIGGNDILNALFFRNLTVPQILSVVIPAAVANVVQGIKDLYNQGGRNFLVYNAPNAGCSTIAITLLAGQAVDSLGCIIFVNQLNQAYNSALATAIQALRNQLVGENIAIFDYYNANLEILTNPTRYGFDPARILFACCGSSTGPLNYNPAIPCGRPGFNKCANPDQYVNWDGVHFTEAFYRVIANFALNGQYTDFPFNYTKRCDLDFDNFRSSVTFDQVYSGTCKVTFT